jgi:hypothetical protein
MKGMLSCAIVVGLWLLSGIIVTADAAWCCVLAGILTALPVAHPFPSAGRIVDVDQIPTWRWGIAQAESGGASVPGGADLPRTNIIDINLASVPGEDASYLFRA